MFGSVMDMGKGTRSKMDSYQWYFSLTPRERLNVHYIANNKEAIETAKIKKLPSIKTEEQINKIATLKRTYTAPKPRSINLFISASLQLALPFNKP